MNAHTHDDDLRDGATGKAHARNGSDVADASHAPDDPIRRTSYRPAAQRRAPEPSPADRYDDSLWDNMPV